MTEQVYILATVRKPELLPAATLVFKTLRHGFPDAQVRVCGNDLVGGPLREVSAAAHGAGASFGNYSSTVHDAWIESLILNCDRPFWICDTDVVFWKLAPQAVASDALFAGVLEPEFEEEWTGTTHVERLHTALMWINPVPLRIAMRSWTGRIPAPWGTTAQYPLIRQHFVPVRRGKTLFYDTMAGLWQAGMGTAFTKKQQECFDHLHCATYVDEITAPSLAGLAEGHRAIYADLNAARGLRARQAEYYKSRTSRSATKRKEGYGIRTTGE